MVKEGRDRALLASERGGKACRSRGARLSDIRGGGREAQDGVRMIEINERNKVDAHNRRALFHGKPATLTFDEWMATLEYFQFKCAYCGGRYQVLEHIDWVGTAGTTKANCVPACNSCNARKYNKSILHWKM